MDEISSFLGRKFGGLPKLALLYSTSQITTCLTEFTSNAATASLLLPILFSLSSELKLHPFLLTLPATVGASFAFSLPAATAPNSIVFSNGRVKVLHMLKTGIPLNIIGNLVTFVAMVTYARPLFKLDSVPTWAINATMSRPLLSQSI
ncbi:unnamed protein product [Dicrocoelium dendriticum]|nr:unnamed protein product [Dicrocoelium dendriticum]